MMLYTYCIPVDKGTAPNPYWGICTLAVCKPRIRRRAQVGDWVVGTGSHIAPQQGLNGTRNLAGSVVYAMQVTQKLTMPEYDAYTLKSLPGKVPNLKATDHRYHLGDSIYDFSAPTAPALRTSRVLHGVAGMATDLNGRYVLLSDHFYYFGDHPIELPEELLPIIKVGPGHKSHTNDPYEREFIRWIEGLGLEPNRPLGNPQIDLRAHAEPDDPCGRYAARSNGPPVTRSTNSGIGGCSRSAFARRSAVIGRTC